jgi:hypothetical protein
VRGLSFCFFMIAFAVLLTFLFYNAWYVHFVYEGMQTSGEKGYLLWFPFQYKICQIDNSAFPGTILLGQFQSNACMHTKTVTSILKKIGWGCEGVI